MLWDGQVARLKLFRHFADILAESASCIAVDMPIGLALRHGRRAEQAARRILGARRSSVFAVPSRAAVACDDYPQACAVNLEHSDPPRKISQQSFHLFPKIREVDAVMTPDLQRRVHEVHPEVCFFAMNGLRPLQFAKKCRAGEAERIVLLARQEFPVPDLDELPYLRREVGRDDVLDACAAAWSARRIANGQALHFPETPDRDARGLVMSIKA